MSQKKNDNGSVTKAKKVSSKPNPSAIKLNKSSEMQIRKVGKDATKSLKNVKITTILMVLIFLMLGAIGGYVLTSYLTRNDTFEMVKFEDGKIDIVIGDEIVNYTELGVKCISFGKEFEFTVEYFYREDIYQDEVKVEMVDENTSGTYYAVYRVDALKYKWVTLIRNISVLKDESNG